MTINQKIPTDINTLLSVFFPQYQAPMKAVTDKEVFKSHFTCAGTMRGYP